MTLEGNTPFQLQNGGMTFFLTSANICQQTRAVQHTRNSKRKITTSLNFSSHLTHILNRSHQKKILIHSQYYSEFILINIPPYCNQKHHNYMSNLLHICTITTDLKFLLKFFSQQVLN